MVPLWTWREEKEGVFLPPLPLSKFVILLLLSFETHLGVEQRKSYSTRRKQECNADTRQLRSRAADAGMLWDALPGSGVHPHCPAQPHLISVLGTPLCPGPWTTAWEGVPIAGPEFGKSVGTGNAQRDCFRLLSSFVSVVPPA